MEEQIEEQTKEQTKNYIAVRKHVRKAGEMGFRMASFYVHNDDRQELKEFATKLRLEREKALGLEVNHYKK